MTEQGGPGEGRALPAIARLIAPVDPAEFFAERFGGAHLLIARDRPDYFSDLMGEADVDRLVAMALAQKTVDGRGPIVELLRPQSKERALLGEVVEAGFAGGATIRVSAVDRIWPPVAALARDVAGEFGAPVSVNLYVTPPNSQGLRCHFDRHDVLVLQIAGRKKWTIRSQAKQWPLEHLPILSFETAQEMLDTRVGHDQFDRDVDDERTDLEMAPGDSLYIAQGRRHEATAASEMTVHLTLGLHSVRHTELAAFTIGRAARDVRWREAAIRPLADDKATIDQLSGLLRALSEDRAALGQGLRGLREALHHMLGAEDYGRQPPPPAPVGLDTVFRRAPRVLFSLDESGDRILVRSGDFQMKAPRAALPALVFIGENRVFRAGDICDNLNPDAKLMLLAKLAEAGLIRATG